ncbi:FkbM family methyltransferase [Prochlorothrix hollandica]|uniref:Methyltransferase FkbM domain-containing protein n=1 Tax=Prochlorothrix hollandica PCC 9006 = CALU 1027 TaxID=317619 RepID=A0A0M2PVL5_PROHO|nr:FkbM family methyltransferase [Prochlorothrix hollandica]KKI99137.1 hypothetical protein PROH_15290 [Prochlorothrix hollandica PCC 9006 = CALU 1027]
MFSLGSTFDLDLRKHLGSLGFQHQSNEPISAYDVISFINEQPCNWKPRKIDKPIALYGAGSLGKMAKEYFDFLEIPIEFFVDRNAKAYQADPFWEGVLIYNPEDVDAQVKSSILLIVCVVTCPLKPLVKKLLEDGWQDVEAFYDVTEAYRDKHPLSNGWSLKDNSNQYSVSKIIDVISNLYDETSIAHYLQFFISHKLRLEWSFQDGLIILKNRFFIPEILQNLTNQESFVDIGAHYGEVFLNFLEITHHRFKSSYLIEPDTINFRILIQTIENLDLEERNKVKIDQIILGHHNRKCLFFEGLGYASQQSKLGTSYLPMVTLDSLDIVPSFLKIHVEGSELSVLEGGKYVICAYKPIIVLTCYHNEHGIYELPIWLINNLPEYKIYWRLHSWHGTGAVIYCIPHERTDLPSFTYLS